MRLHARHALSLGHSTSDVNAVLVILGNVTICLGVVITRVNAIGARKGFFQHALLLSARSSDVRSGLLKRSSFIVNDFALVSSR